MFVLNNSVNPTTTGEGVTRKILASAGTLMMVEVTFKKGAEGAVHGHVHEQASYIVNGSFEFNLNGNKQHVKKGDTIYIPTNVLHGVLALEDDSIILDVFTPQREDFLSK